MVVSEIKDIIEPERVCNLVGWLANLEILINGIYTRVTHKELSHVLRKREMGGGGV